MSTSTEDALKLAERLKANPNTARDIEAADAIRALVAEKDEWQAACARAQENADHWTAEAARYAAESRSLVAERGALREALREIDAQAAAALAAVMEHERHDTRVLEKITRTALELRPAMRQMRAHITTDDMVAALTAAATAPTPPEQRS